MRYRKKIVCLANSERVGERCVAGLEVTEKGFGRWVRPISESSSEGQIAKQERQYENGEEARLLDVISIVFSDRYEAKKPQLENHLIDDEYCWELKARLSWECIQGAVEEPGELWLNGFSSHYGTNNQVPHDEAVGLDTSLCLIRPDDLKFTVAEERDEVKVRAKFQLQGIEYGLSVTDPEAENHCLQTGRRIIVVPQALLCVSLAETHVDGFAYKLVAGVITPDTAIVNG